MIRSLECGTDGRIAAVDVRVYSTCTRACANVADVSRVVSEAVPYSCVSPKACVANYVTVSVAVYYLSVDATTPIITLHLLCMLVGSATCHHLSYLATKNGGFEVCLK